MPLLVVIDGVDLVDDPQKLVSCLPKQLHQFTRICVTVTSESDVHQLLKVRCVLLCNRDNIYFNSQLFMLVS